MFSKRARYALHGVGYLAYRHAEAPVPFAEILEYLEDYSGELALSRGYLAKIFQDLARAGVVRASPGRRGGYGLARAPESISMLEVFEAVDGPRHPDDCCLLSVGLCTNQADCGVHELVAGAESAFFGHLAGSTAASLAAGMFRSRGPLGAPPWSGRPRGTRAGRAR